MMKTLDIPLNGYAFCVLEHVGGGLYSDPRLKA